MAVTKKKRRFRRVRLRKPFYQVVRRYVAQLPPSTLDNPGLVQTEAQDEVTMPVTTKAVESGELAHFEPEYNPYAYMVSQLPNMLGSIPDLVLNNKADITPVEQSKPSQTIPIDTGVLAVGRVKQGKTTATELRAKPIVDRPAELLDEQYQQQTKPDAVSNEPKVQSEAVTEKPSKSSEQAVIEPSNSNELWLRWFECDYDDWDFSEQLQQLLRQSQPLKRDFPWPGLPEKSCRQRCFGGSGIKEPSQTHTPSHEQGFMAVLLLAAQSVGSNINELFLLLSEPIRVANLLARSPIEKHLKPLSLHREILLADLSLKEYLDSLFCQSLVKPNTHWPEKFLPPKALTQHREVTINALPALLRGYVESQSAIVINIKNQQFNIYVELIEGNVEVLSLGQNTAAYTPEVFIDNLLSLLGQYRVNSTVEVQIYATPGRIGQQLTQDLERNQVIWQRHLEHSLFRFVTSSSSNINSAESID